MDRRSLAARLTRVPLWLREVLFIGVLYGVYELTRGVQQSTIASATRNGWNILHLERMLDLAPEHLLTKALLAVTPLAVAAAYFYSTAHYLVTPAVLIWMYRCHRGPYTTARSILAAGTFLGLLGFWLVPTAPPRLLRGAGVPDALFDLRHWGWWGGEGSVPRGLGSLTNQFAAMPSLHVGWALWCGVLMFRYSSKRVVRWLGVAYPVATTLVVLSTGNHYLLDAVAGIAVMALGAWIVLAARKEIRKVRSNRRAAGASPTVAAARARYIARTTPLELPLDEQIERSPSCQH